MMKTLQRSFFQTSVVFKQKWFANCVKILITAGILFYLYRQGLLDFSRVKKIWNHPHYILIGFTCLMFTTLAAVWRWKFLLQGQGITLSFWSVFKLTMIGVFFNTALPGAVSGDLVKAYYISKSQQGTSRIKGLTTLLLDRLLGLTGLIFISFSSLCLFWEDLTQWPSLRPFALFILVLALSVAVFYSFVLIRWPFTSKILQLLHEIPVVGKLALKLYESIKIYEHHRRLLVCGMLLSILIHTCLMAFILFLASILGGFEEVSTSQFLFLAPLGLLVTALPLAPAGLGTGHVAFLGLFQLVGSKNGADLFTAYVSFQIAFSLMASLFYFPSRRPNCNRT